MLKYVGIVLVLLVAILRALLIILLICAVAFVWIALYFPIGTKVWTLLQSLEIHASVFSLTSCTELVYAIVMVWPSPEYVVIASV